MAATVVQRHATMPMMKRDSVNMNGSRLSLLSTQSGTSRTKEDTSEGKAFSTHKGGGHSKSKNVKRTDSYRRATNRQSVYDDLDDFKVTETNYSSTRGTVEYRKKYNTLPKVDTIVSKPSNGHSVLLQEAREGKSRRSRDDLNNASGAAFSRHSNASRRSGTCPSPDTDEDQRSVQPERKKKSTFKRVKERLIQTFTRDKGNRRMRKEPANQHGRVRPNLTPSKHGYGSRDSSRDDLRGSAESGRIVLQGRQDSSGSDVNKKGVIQTFRDSFRRKKNDRDHSQGSTDFNHRRPASVVQPSDDRRPSIDADEFLNISNNEVTKFFSALIDTPIPKGTGDRSKLRLEGLRICRPGSFTRSPPRARGPPSDQGRVIFGRQHSSQVEVHSNGRTSTTHGEEEESVYSEWRANRGDLSPDVETDGLDFPDMGGSSPIHTVYAASDDEVAELDEILVDQDPRLREVACRLKAIGDRLTGSEIDRHRRGDEADHASVVEELRALGDDIDKRYFQGPNSLAPSVLPIIRDLVFATSYGSFQEVLHRELSKTIGWEQVAWYTYITKAAIDIGGVGKDVGKKIKSRALRYFNTKFRSFVESQPKGWESVVEDTDIDSELD